MLNYKILNIKNSILLIQIMQQYSSILNTFQPWPNGMATSCICCFSVLAGPNCVYNAQFLQKHQKEKREKCTLPAQASPWSGSKGLSQPDLLASYLDDSESLYRFRHPWCISGVNKIAQKIKMVFNKILEKFIAENWITKQKLTKDEVHKRCLQTELIRLLLLLENAFPPWDASWEASSMFFQM